MVNLHEQDVMKCRKISILFLLCLGKITLFAQAPDAREIIRKAQDLVTGKSAEAEISITIVRPKWSREMVMKSWSKGKKLAVILVTEPAKEHGIVFLKRDQEVWNWMPSIERIIKLPPSMMSQSWMGTDFTNDDLVKEVSIEDDYNHNLIGIEKVAGTDCNKIELIPKPDAAVVWGKIIVWIDKQSYIQYRSEFYDEDGELVNTMTASEVILTGNRKIASKLEVIPADKRGHKTVLKYKSIYFDRDIADEFFNVNNIRRIR